MIGEASTLGQHLSTRRELLWDHRNDQMYITSKDTSISRTPEACSHYLHELRPPCESEIVMYLNGGASNAGIQPSQFANSAPPKHDGSLVLPTEVVPMDLSDGHHGGSNTQNLHGTERTTLVRRWRQRRHVWNGLSKTDQKHFALTSLSAGICVHRKHHHADSQHRIVHTDK